MLGRSTAEDSSAKRGRVDGCPGREVRPWRVSALQHGVLAQPRVASRHALAAAPEAHALQDLRRGAHPTGWCSR
eukprot:8249093-Alexandrium_andersonii.AAC.1